MVDQKLVDNIISDLVPQKYLPSGSLYGDGPGYITCFSVEPKKDRFDNFVAKIAGSTTVPAQVSILTFCWADLMEATGAENVEPFEDKFGIFVNGSLPDLGVLELEYKIAHAVGVVDWFIEQKQLGTPWEVFDLGLYAEAYALNILSAYKGEDAAKLMVNWYGNFWKVKEYYLHA